MEKKRETARLWIENGRSVAEVCSELALPRSTVYYWRKKYGWLKDHPAQLPARKLEELLRKSEWDERDQRNLLALCEALTRMIHTRPKKKNDESRVKNSLSCNDFRKYQLTHE